MTDLYPLVSNALFGLAVVWLLLRQRPVKKEKKKQHARAGRDIGTQAGRDITQHYYGLPEHMGPREQSLVDTVNKLLAQLQEKDRQLQEKDRQLQAGTSMKLRLMDRVELLDEANSGLLEEVARLRTEQAYLPILELKSA